MTLSVWRFIDGKAGHERQSRGLVRALAERTTVSCEDVDVRTPGLSGWHIRAEALPEGEVDLLVGAGRAVQWPLARSRHLTGARAVYLMKPTWPRRWFDLCLVPAHDGVAPGPAVELTTGVLNDVEATGLADHNAGLILVGGPSRHHRWDTPGLIGCIERIVAARADVHWTIADSRRTPADSRGALAAVRGPGVEFVAHEDTDPDWLQARLVHSGTVWVTADSISMLFEALSAGAGVGLLEVPVRRADRVAGVAAALVAAGRVTRFDTADLTAPLPAAPPLAEARRCADLILRRWFSGRATARDGS